jgi:formylglycine-generating enzyme
MVERVQRRSAGQQPIGAIACLVASATSGCWADLGHLQAGESSSEGSAPAAGSGGTPQGSGPGPSGGIGASGAGAGAGTSGAGSSGATGGAASSGGVTGSGGASSSGVTGSGGDSSGVTGGGSSSGGAGGDGGATGCPSGGGPTMIDVGSHCIDATEVTKAQYEAFLATSPPLQSAVGPPYCSWNASYLPAGPWPAGPDLPITFVDWCDAHAFCAWANKRLCGAIGGGSNPFAAYDDAGASQWFHACSQGGTSQYPYGNSYSGTVCVSHEYDGAPGVQASDAAQPVGGAALCHGLAPPYDGLRDLSGNVSEWEDSCEAYLGDSDKCRRRGGSYIEGPGGDLRCADTSNSSRETSSATIGFRCCSP